jgi:hypothetical protein
VKTLPNNFNRRGWLALWAQGRRRKRQIHLLPAPELWAEYPGVLKWTWNLANPHKWNVWMSMDNQATWMLVGDYWGYGDARQFAPDGGGEHYYIVGVDEFGREITEHSNIIRPDDTVIYINFENGLVTHFPFNEASGNRTGLWTPFQLEPLGGSVGSAPGFFGNAVAFDGAGGYLAGTDDTDMFMASPDGLAVAMWLDFTSVADPYSTTYVASLWNDTAWPSGSLWHLMVVPGDNWISAEVLGDTFGFNGLSGVGDCSGWVHVCLVFEPLLNLWTLYANGAAIATVECDGRVAVGKLGVGAHTNPVTSPPDYLVDELTIWGRSLSATEVSALYNNGSGYPHEWF